MGGDRDSFLRDELVTDKPHLTPAAPASAGLSSTIPHLLPPSAAHNPWQALPSSSLLFPHPTLARTLPTTPRSESFNPLPSALALASPYAACLECEDHSCTTLPSAFNSSGCTLKRSEHSTLETHWLQRLTTSKPSTPTLKPEADDGHLGCHLPSFLALNGSSGETQSLMNWMRWSKPSRDTLFYKAVIT